MRCTTTRRPGRLGLAALIDTSGPLAGRSRVALIVPPSEPESRTDPVTLPPTLPVFPQPPASAIALLAREQGVSELGALTLVGLDRALRSLAAGGVLTAAAPAGWVLSGTTALHGVYLRSSKVVRIPDELVLGRISDAPVAPADLSALIATALPKGALVSVEGERHRIGFRGPMGGENALIVRYETPRLRMDPPGGVATRVDLPSAGFLFDARMVYRSAASLRPIPVPVAWVEELITRLFVILARPQAAPGAQDEQVLRADDLRCLLRVEPDEVRVMVAGPVRNALIAAVGPKVGNDPGQIATFLAGMAESIRRTAERTMHPDAVGPDLSGEAGRYGRDERSSVLARVDGLAAALREGR